MGMSVLASDGIFFETLDAAITPLTGIWRILRIASPAAKTGEAL
jgi:hypothetical protein